MKIFARKENALARKDIYMDSCVRRYVILGNGGYL